MNQIEKMQTQRSALQRLPEELLDSPLFLLKRLGMAAKERSLEEYTAAGLHPYHHAILALLDEGVRETQGQIADALGYDKGQLVGLLDELEEGGLVERRRDPSDRRRQTVQITAAGRRKLDRMRAVSRRIEDEFLGDLSESQRRELHALLLRACETHFPNCRAVTASSLVAAGTD